MPFTARINFGLDTTEEDQHLRLTLIALIPLDYTGHCYGRSPPSGAGREAAGHISKSLRDSGSLDPTPGPVWILRAAPKTFTK